MPGRPKRAEDLVALDTMGVERVEELLESAMPIAQVCRELRVGKRALFEWLDTPERSGLLARARARAAHLLAEDALTIADQAEVDQVQVSRLRVDTRKWLAAKWNAGAYGEQRGPLVNIDLGSLFLGAAKAAAPVALEQDAGDAVQDGN
jgi:transposase-like protein